MATFPATGNKRSFTSYLGRTFFLVELVDERPKTGVSITAFGVAAVLGTTNTRPVIVSPNDDDRSSVDGAWKGQLTFLKRPTSDVGQQVT